MKKTLSVLLTLILTFSCFSILGISTVSAEKQTTGQEIIKSDFKADYEKFGTLINDFGELLVAIGKDYKDLEDNL